jgi:murein DD-endopeptidase MepM/ murein hydrolase activator NlpD
MPLLLISAVLSSACWLPPVDAQVIDPFRQPQCIWCPGNRGLEYGTGAGATVRSVAAGYVTFSGSVAGTPYVVVRHVDGRRATYGGVTGARWRQGDLVVARAVIGVTTGDLHFGLREGDRYLDPAPHVGELVHRARLIPVDSRLARPAPAPRLRCTG